MHKNTPKSMEKPKKSNPLIFYGYVPDRAEGEL